MPSIFQSGYCYTFQNKKNQYEKLNLQLDPDEAIQYRNIKNPMRGTEHGKLQQIWFRNYGTGCNLDPKGDAYVLEAPILRTKTKESNYMIAKFGDSSSKQEYELIDYKSIPQRSTGGARKMRKKRQSRKKNKRSKNRKSRSNKPRKSKKRRN